jgi:hypothetical protein
MKRVEELTHEECQEVLNRIVRVLYEDIDPETDKPILNPDNEWNVEMLDDIAAALESYEILPDEIVELEPTKMDQEQAVARFSHMVPVSDGWYCERHLKHSTGMNAYCKDCDCNSE